MTDRIIELVLDESKWLTTAMLIAITAALVTVYGRRRPTLSRRQKVFWTMNLFYACMIGVMAIGHLLAVATKHATGALEGSPAALYSLGVVLAVPSWWLVLRSGLYARDEARWRRRAAALNGALGLCLLAAGVHNGPLAAPAALNIAYAFHTRRAVGWTIVSVTIVANTALFVGSLVFLASGQSFEQFKDM